MPPSVTIELSASAGVNCLVASGGSVLAMTLSPEAINVDAPESVDSSCA